ncbi:2-amino-4-hydroxy-6-hydroxymethyldihydropteridine diphosphokinase [Herbaspirillum sp. YR522]|uniref:2-amino-4-hydroxy-6- hydroxymethyldihydropteridine diphosphokinase n=1 Tax=Herbaspirillum sp. YR522 TaxID=1144342 RepID=UPI00026F88B6|nr:2-amino-4-hydroxy-6-hydroxymethyldihydropteridine diphosphokinase [Herbaspirillum sp. YR522]EJM98201.1 2-amino-4-hydroxy-6-hydroxymethyldihydropteridine pyrophosphokinase [Herbaspirillum sp. YR522]
MPVIAHVGIGANLGDARASVEQAIGQLAGLAGSRLLERSSLYRSAPIDAGGDDYVNAVAAVLTDLPPLELLHALQRIEQQHGRLRPYRNAPRTLDMDLLLYGGQCIHSDELTVPHPRMMQRAFVLVPLLEIAPAIVVPGHGPAQARLAGVAGQVIARL